MGIEFGCFAEFLSIFDSVMSRVILPMVAFSSLSLEEILSIHYISR